jgi:hypothetical protein
VWPEELGVDYGGMSYAGCLVHVSEYGKESSGGETCWLFVGWMCTRK